MDFDRIIQDYSGLIWRIAANYEASQNLREDLHQDILFAVWKAMPSYRGEAGIKTFIARIAHNRGVSHIVKEMRHSGKETLEIDVRIDACNPEELADHNLKREALASAVIKLPLKYRQVIGLTLESFSPSEIAEILGLSANVVSIRLTRAKSQLRNIL